jgi:hypothetical protein
MDCSTKLIAFFAPEFLVLKKESSISSESLLKRIWVQVALEKEKGED